MEVSEVPEVTLSTSDGRTVECDLERAPELDRGEGDPRGAVTYWRAVPRERVDLQTCEVRHTTPPHTAFFVDVPQAGLESLRADGA